MSAPKRPPSHTAMYTRVSRACANCGQSLIAVVEPDPSIQYRHHNGETEEGCTELGNEYRLLFPMSKDPLPTYDEVNDFILGQQLPPVETLVAEAVRDALKRESQLLANANARIAGLEMDRRQRIQAAAELRKEMEQEIRKLTAMLGSTQKELECRERETATDVAAAEIISYDRGYHACMKHLHQMEQECRTNERDGENYTEPLEDRVVKELYFYTEWEGFDEIGGWDGEPS